MHIAHILEELAYDGGELPREAIESAIAKRVDITPYLLSCLEEAVLHIDEIIDNDTYQGHLYAMYLLAQFREKRAFPLILQLFSYPGNIPHLIAGDVLTEDFSRILASVSMGEIAPLKRMIENPMLNEYVRAAASTALVILAGCRLISRVTVLEYFSELLRGRLERRSSFVWDNLIACICDLYPEELYEEVVGAFRQGLIDDNFITLDDVHSILSEDREEHLAHLYHSSELIDDTVTEMEKWSSQPELN